MDDQDFRSFADPDTHFIIVTSDTPVTVDGIPMGAPTGEIRCAVCWAKASAPEYIPHQRVDGKECPQADVRSEWYAKLH